MQWVHAHDHPKTGSVNIPTTVPILVISTNPSDNVLFGLSQFMCLCFILIWAWNSTDVP